MGTSRSLTLLVVILASLTAFSPLSIDIYLPSFPQIAADFGVSVAKVEFSLATFFTDLSFGQLLYGTATDRFGRKKPLYVGLSIYCAASFLCAFAPNVETLIILRLFQALGACGGIVIARAVDSQIIFSAALRKSSNQLITKLLIFLFLSRIIHSG